MIDEIYDTYAQYYRSKQRLDMDVVDLREEALGVKMVSRYHRCGTCLHYLCNNNTWGLCSFKMHTTEPRRGLFCRSYCKSMNLVQLNDFYKNSVNVQIGDLRMSNNLDKIVVTLDNYNIATLLTGGEVHIGVNISNLDSYTDVVIQLNDTNVKENNDSD